MIIGSCQVYLRANWVNSLKEKRSVIKSIIEKSKNKFNISISEVGSQDSHKDITIGFVCVSNSKAHANSTLQSTINYIETITEAELVDVDMEII